MNWVLLLYALFVPITRLGVKLTGKPPFTSGQLWLLSFVWPLVLLKFMTAIFNGTCTWRRIKKS